MKLQKEKYWVWITVPVSKEYFKKIISSVLEINYHFRLMAARQKIKKEKVSRGGAKPKGKLYYVSE